MKLFNIIKKILPKKKPDLRELCVYEISLKFGKDAGEKFGNMYDDMQLGIPIGGVKETIDVLEVIEFVKHKYGIEK